MKSKTLLTFNRLEFVQRYIYGSEVVAQTIVDGHKNHIEIENIRVPRMIDVLGNKYYLVNRNNYLVIKGNTDTLIIVELVENSEVQTVLTEWLDSLKIPWNLIPEKQEVPKDENSSEITDLQP